MSIKKPLFYTTALLLTKHIFFYLLELLLDSELLLLLDEFLELDGVEELFSLCLLSELTRALLLLLRLLDSLVFTDSFLGVGVVVCTLLSVFVLG